MSEQTPSMPSAGDSPGGVAGEIIAPAASYYRMTRYIMVLVMIGMGGWFAYDGWVNWPDQNRRLAEIEQEMIEAQARNDSQAIATLTAESKQYTAHSETDIRLQKRLAFALPPLGIALLIWALYNSRGAYRLSGNTLHIPGHPPITLDQVRGINRAKWDKKGIAYVDYETPEKRGTFKLDDFVYDRAPTDAIFDRIGQHLNQQSAEPQQQA